MKDKKQYYSLDEIGFVGSQEKRIKTVVAKNINDTVQYIKSQKRSKIELSSRKRLNSHSTSKTSQ